jgi:hypothetical protein
MELDGVDDDVDDGWPVADVSDPDDEVQLFRRFVSLVGAVPLIHAEREGARTVAAGGLYFDKADGPRPPREPSLHVRIAEVEAVVVRRCAGDVVPGPRPGEPASLVPSRQACLELLEHEGLAEVSVQREHLRRREATRLALPPPPRGPPFPLSWTSRRSRVRCADRSRAGSTRPRPRRKDGNCQQRKKARCVPNVSTQHEQ